MWLLGKNSPKQPELVLHNGSADTLEVKADVPWIHLGSIEHDA